MVWLRRSFSALSSLAASKSSFPGRLRAAGLQIRYRLPAGLYVFLFHGFAVQEAVLVLQGAAILFCQFLVFGYLIANT